MRAAIGGATVAGMVGAVLIGAPAASAGGVPLCEVVTMPQPASSLGGIVMDLEQVPGRGTVYAGGLTLLEDGSYSRQPVVWFGLDGEPQPVGPRDMDGVVHELRPTGLISGQSTDAEGREYAWVQSLRSGRITIVDAGTTERFWVQHINDRGAAAGSVWVSDFDIEARVWWPRVDRPSQVLPDDGEGASAYDLTNDRRVAGAFDIGDFQTQAVIWETDGTATPLAGNPGSSVYSSARLINERGEAAGFAWFGGHLEAARWRTPTQLESLGLLPEGGDSMAYGQAEGGWVVGFADHQPDDPEVNLGPISHAALWTDEIDHVRVLPSPYAVEHGIEDWREWLSGGAYGVHTGLDQAAGSAQSAMPGNQYRSDPVVWVEASRCGERVATTHTAYWE